MDFVKKTSSLSVDHSLEVAVNKLTNALCSVLTAASWSKIAKKCLTNQVPGLSDKTTLPV